MVPRFRIGRNGDVVVSEIQFVLGVDSGDSPTVQVPEEAKVRGEMAG